MKKVIKTWRGGNTVTQAWHSLDDDRFYWCIVPDGIDVVTALNTQRHHGPFATMAAAEEDQVARLFTEQGGRDKPQ